VTDNREPTTSDTGRSGAAGSSAITRESRLPSIADDEELVLDKTDVLVLMVLGLGAGSKVLGRTEVLRARS
jgi:hypothetical protein